MKTSDNQPAWVAILVAIIIAIVGPVIVWNFTSRSVQSQKDDTSALAQEVNSIANRVDHISLTVQAISTTLPSEVTPQQPLVEPSDIENLTTQISALEQQVAAILMRPTPTPLSGPLASSSDLDALKSRVLDLEKMIEQFATPSPMTVATVLARDGIPIDEKLQVIRARASSTNPALNADEKPMYEPQMAIDSAENTGWLASSADREKAWFEIDLDSIRTISGIRFLGYDQRGYRFPPFRDAILTFSNSAAQELHFTQAQLNTTGWKYFPLTPTQADQIRIVILSPLNEVGFAEVEIYGK